MDEQVDEQKENSLNKYLDSILLRESPCQQTDVGTPESEKHIESGLTNPIDIISDGLGEEFRGNSGDMLYSYENPNDSPFSLSLSFRREDGPLHPLADPTIAQVFIFSSPFLLYCSSLFVDVGHVAIVKHLLSQITTFRSSCQIHIST